MAGLTILKLIFVAALFEAVTSKSFHFNIFGPENPFNIDIPQDQLEQYTERTPVYKHFVFGENVEGAAGLSSFEFNNSYHTQHSEISSGYSYPYKWFNDVSKNITKIDVLVEEFNEENEPEVLIEKGGVGEKNVSLQISAKNTTTLHYKVLIYGI